MSRYHLDDQYKEVMRRPIDGTPLATFDVYLLGLALLDLVSTSQTMGHASPAHTYDYVPMPQSEDHVSKHILRDFTCWVSGRKQLSPGCVDRLSTWIGQEWQRAHLESSAGALGLSTEDDVA